MLTHRKKGNQRNQPNQRQRRVEGEAPSGLSVEGATCLPAGTARAPIDEPKPFGVEYVPYKHRLKPKKDGWVHVGYVSDIPVGKSKSLDLEKVKVAIFNIDGKFFAIKDACPHAQYPLAKGTLRGDVVSCSSHNWQFNVKTGQCVRADHDTDCESVVVRTFEVELREEEIWVK